MGTAPSLLLLSSLGCVGIWPGLEMSEEEWEGAGTDTAQDDSCRSGSHTEHVGFEMVRICPGTFTLGSPAEEVGRDGDEDAHTVTLTRTYLVGNHEVTQALFKDYMGYQPSSSRDCSTCPVEDVTWHQAADFANAVSDRAGLDRCYACTGARKYTECELDGAWSSPYSCPGYRLPTEAEWEHAVRGGESTTYHNGGNLLEISDTYDCDGNLELDNGEYLDDIAWYCGNSDDRTQPVGQLDPNSWNLYDGHGNVWEWCHDIYDTTWETAKDPWGPSTGSARVGRGGSWDATPGHLRSADRDDFASDYANVGLGFRLARTE